LESDYLEIRNINVYMTMVLAT